MIMAGNLVCCMIACLGPSTSTHRWLEPDYCMFSFEFHHRRFYYTRPTATNRHRQAEVGKLACCMIACLGPSTLTHRWLVPDYCMFSFEFHHRRFYYTRPTATNRHRQAEVGKLACCMIACLGPSTLTHRWLVPDYCMFAFAFHRRRSYYTRSTVTSHH